MNRANRDTGVNVYFIMETKNGAEVKLHLNTDFDVVGFAAHQADEFQIAVPPDRPELLIVNTRSFVPRLGQEPVAVRGLRVRVPTELANIAMFDSRAAIPPRFRRGAMEIALPA